MRAYKDVQRTFHIGADENRYFNRLQNPYIARKERALAKRVAHHLSGSRAALLEIGCGEGSNLAYLRELLPDADLTGADFSRAKIAFMMLHIPSVKGVCSDAASLPFSSNRYDVVLLRDLLHHVHFDRESVIQEANRVLKPGGKLLVLESDGRRIVNRIFRFFYPAEQGMRESTPAKLLPLLDSAGSSTFEYVEASFMLRAAAFFLGWRDGVSGIPLKLLYELIGLWETLVELLLPQDRWFYFMFTVEKKPLE